MTFDCSMGASATARHAEHATAEATTIGRTLPPKSSIFHGDVGGNESKEVKLIS
eukprot:CAMPEP_0115830234 /NCGR_PEP_ID=MMETSP0287-20121206/1514_1 /TAXON_ID=412157 /ORGANISM="Chrysochromulina rotalis, Strain UIO044" /LENGTH=53 /DNA_ID=CAMNT_0003283535 /DNA_START=426 /DNA_END=587 /DNA_ORIENTATION=+